MEWGGSAPTGAARSQHSWPGLLESSTSLELSSGFAGPLTSVARKPSERIDEGGAATRSEAMLRGDGRRGIEDDRGAEPEGLAARPHLRADLERPALRGISIQTTPIGTALPHFRAVVSLPYAVLIIAVLNWRNAAKRRLHFGMIQLYHRADMPATERGRRLTAGPRKRPTPREAF